MLCVVAVLRSVVFGYVVSAFALIVLRLCRASSPIFASCGGVIRMPLLLQESLRRVSLKEEAQGLAEAQARTPLTRGGAREGHDLTN